MKAILKTLLLSWFPSEEAPLTEAKRVYAEIIEAQEKLKYAWSRLDYAAPDYVEITVLDLLVLESQYELLNKRYRLLLGLNQESPSSVPPTAKSLSYFLEGQLSNNPSYGALFNSAEENPPSGTPLWTSQNP